MSISQALVKRQNGKVIILPSLVAAILVFRSMNIVLTKYINTCD